MFSVDTEEEAKMLIVMACPTDMAGNYYASELAEEQTLRNLRKFSDKLATCWNFMQKRKREKNTKKKMSKKR